MPTIAATEATVWLHCRNVRCPGSNQEELAGTREESSWTFGENGGDGVFINFVEKSMVEFKAAPEDLPCPACGEPREVTGEPRPTYLNLSGHNPMGLVEGLQFDPGVKNTPQDAEIAELRAQVARLAAAVEGKDAA